MHVSPRTRSVLLALAAGSVPLLLALSLRGQPAPKAIPPKANSPLAVAQALDAIVQPRFQDTSMIVFGVNRVGPQSVKHPPVNLIPKTSQEAAILKTVAAAHRDYILSFLHCVPVPPGGSELARNSQGYARQLPQFAAPQVHFLPMPGLSNLSLTLPATPFRPFVTNMIVHSPASGSPKIALAQKAVTKAGLNVLPRLRLGQEAHANVDGWTVLMRPIPAAQSSCLTCHTGAKRGDTLGVMVYAVSNTVSKN